MVRWVVLTPGWTMPQSDFIYRGFLKQELVSHDEDIAKKLATKARPRKLQPNDTLYAKGDEANFIYFILDGSCKLVDGNKVIAVRENGQSLGEFPLLGESRAYAVTAVAREDSFIAEVSYSHFRDIAEKHSRIWEMMAAKLAKRLNEPLHEDATRDHLIILVHGIRTFAAWQPKLKAVLKKAN
jgi:CRP-like cAMP-binding protein